MHFDIKFYVVDINQIQFEVPIQRVDVVHFSMVHSISNVIADLAG